ncbi:MAG: fibronectin type III domain-containing protein, partial [Chloroflexi bacterium]|nr:fibronectin type III domain-containing protein [Chloroflexota bacterium]
MTTSNHAITADGLQRANVIVTARFDVALGQVPAGVQSAMDARVVMEFSPGLQADGDDATFALETGTNNVKQVSDLSYEAGVFNIGQTLDGVEFQMTLPVRVTAGASSTGRLCVTATIEAQPFTGIGQFRDDATDNAAKECWGPAPAGELQVLVSGTADLFTWYDCVGKSAPPCDRKDDGDATTNDDLQLVAFVGAAAEDFGIFQPSQVVVHIPDPGGRAEGKTGGLVWSTGFENWGSCQGLNPNCLPGDRDRPGVIIARNTAWLDLESTNDDDRWGTPHTNTAFAAYETGYLKVSASAPASGKMTAYRLRSSDRATLLLWSTSADGVKHEATAEILARTPEVGYSSADTGLMWVEFTKLGTYEMTLRVKADYETNVNDTMGGNNPTPPTNHEDEATYTFHVGPLADLSVASGASPHVAADRNALTIVAANNGPDNTADAEVKIALPSGALVEDHVASDGTYSNGVWTLTGLQSRDYRRSSGKPEAATLTLILKDGGVPKEPAGGTIRLTDNSYNVCIDSKRNTLAHETQADCKADAKTTDTWHSAVCVQDSDQTVNTLATHDTQAECEALTGHTWTANVCASSASKVIANRTEAECDGWHTGTVYDPPANNTAKITAVKGTDIGAWPADLRFAATPLLTWEAVPHVNDWPVHRYQVQYQNGDNWQDLAEVPGDQTYFADSDARSKPSYRVRALNEAGVPGFWSRAASQVTYRQALPPSPPLNVTAVAGHAGEVVVSWELPVDDGGSPITYYQVQWSRSGTGGWSNACRSEGPSDLSCTQTGIPAGETRYYRVAAYAGGLGDWSDLAVATTIPGVPSAPRGLSASRAPQDLGGETILAIRLNWSAPATDNGSPIYAYAVEYVDYDQSAGRCGTDWQYLGGDPGIHSNDPPTRQFLDTGEYEWIGLEPGAHRCYRVSAINSAGEGPFSNVARASAGGAVPPEWVYLDGEADGQNAITLYWAERDQQVRVITGEE